MFTGIIEELGEIVSIEKDRNNLNLGIKSNFYKELQIDQSIAHNGVCLTVIDIRGDFYIVTAIKETLDKTNLSLLEVGNLVNLERAMKLGERLDGHIVQGHVDQTAVCIDKKNEKGSWIFSFEYSSKYKNLTIEKGSITINGISLTVINSNKNSFSVAIIPYTYEATNIKYIDIKSIVNIEFDVIGKYVAKMQQYY